MRILFISILCFISSLCLAQLRADTLTIDSFIVNKDGRATLIYTYLEGADIKYTIEGKVKNQAPQFLFGNENYPIFQNRTGNRITERDTFALKLPVLVSEVCVLFTKPQTKKLIIKSP